MRLVQVKTLAGAEVPLADIGPLLDCDAAPFAAAIADVEQHLTARIAALATQRDMLNRLTSSDRTLLPDRAVAMLEAMPALGFTREDVRTARESFVLAKALVPESFAEIPSRFACSLSNERWCQQSPEPSRRRCGLPRSEASLHNVLLLDPSQKTM
ncbi:hypothetical protein AB0J43_04020 [Nonomuraea fuscirosea]